MDYFRSDPNGIASLGSKGDRIATVLIYLGTPEEGGETTFPRVGLNVPAIQVCMDVGQSLQIGKCSTFLGSNNRLQRRSTHNTRRQTSD